MLASGRPWRRRTGMLAVPLRAGEARTAELAALDAATGGRLARELGSRGREAEGLGRVWVYQSHGALPADLVALVGLGSATEPAAGEPERWRRFAAAAVAAARRERVSELSLSVASATSRHRAAAVAAVAEGALLEAYRYTELKTGAGRAMPRSCVLLGAGRDGAAALRRGEVLGEATCWARDLVNRPAEQMTPARLAGAAREVARSARVVARVLGPAELRRIGAGALLAVGRGSRNPPRLIELVYRPARRAPASAGAIVLVGKGITFDSGGLSLKPTASMRIQKRDMAGAAAVLGAMRAIAALRPPVEVRAVVAAAENMPGGGAYRPGDVVRTLAGRTVEVQNTDAEGRLVLADALAYAARRARPRWIVDLATLTGAASVALGRSVAAVLGTDDDLVARLIDAGGEAGEKIWRLPLVDEYARVLESPVADLRNTGDGTAGTIFGGLFLREFVSGLPWAHLDIAGVAYAEKARPCQPVGATGWGVRTLVGLIGGGARDQGR